MYASTLKRRDKSSAGAAALVLQAALLFAFLNLAGRPEVRDTQVPLQLVDVPIAPTPPPPLQRQQPAKAADKVGGSAPANRASKATPVVAPTPRVRTPAVAPIQASATPRTGLQASEGAAPVRGPGTGGGGSGNGTGEGAGSGSGDGGGVVEPPRLASSVLTGYDFSREMIDAWPRGATVFLRLRIDARGYISECLLDRGTNVPLIDSEMCNTAHERLRFRPALDRSGQPVAGWFGYAQPAPR